MSIWNSFEPSAVLATVGPLTIHWYGLIVAFAAVVGYGIALHSARINGIDRAQLSDSIFYCIIFGLLGARLYHVVGELSYYIANPLQIIAVWHGGLAIHGGVIGGALALFVYSRKHVLSAWKMADVMSIGLVVGQAIGRWGNFFNQELYGTPTDVPWKISISLHNRLPDYLQYQYYHPTFLYESVLNALLFVLLFFLLRRRQLPDGSIVLVYAIGYSLIRFGMEFLRFEPTVLLFGVRFPQLLSVGVIIGAGYLLYARLRLSNNSCSAKR